MNEAKGVHRAVDIVRAAGVPLEIAAKMREPAEIEYFRTQVEPRRGLPLHRHPWIGADAAQQSTLASRWPGWSPAPCATYQSLLDADRIDEAALAGFMLDEDGRDDALLATSN